MVVSGLEGTWTLFRMLGLGNLQSSRGTAFPIVRVRHDRIKCTRTLQVTCKQGSRQKSKKRMKDVADPPSGSPSSSLGSSASFSPSVPRQQDQDAGPSGQVTLPQPNARSVEATPSHEPVPQTPNPTDLAERRARQQSPALPPAERDQVLAACTVMSVVLAATAFALRGGAAWTGFTGLAGDPDLARQLLRWPQAGDMGHAALAVCLAGGVTAARVALLSVWSDFALATNTSNRQTLPKLTLPDLVFVAVATGVPEEYLFRGALVPLIAPDWRGVLVAGVVFGVLHNSGGRNLAFAAWAAVVGLAYGWAFLATQDVFVPMAAHSLANLASGVLWLSNNKEESLD